MAIDMIDSYNVDEEHLYSKPYLFIKGAATVKNYKLTLKALPFARMIHNGQYRRGLAVVDGKEVQLPYIVHCLKVCSTLIALNLPMSDEELDLLYACALLHDTLEDGKDYFPNGGTEFSSAYGFTPDVEMIIKLLSKQPGADDETLNAYFNNIKKNKYALLIKLADRSHNVEDLYNMRNIHKYIAETRAYILDGLCKYGKANYPELSNGITILKSKILSLTETTETIIAHYEAIIEDMKKHAS